MPPLRRASEGRAGPRLLPAPGSTGPPARLQHPPAIHLLERPAVGRARQQRQRQGAGGNAGHAAAVHDDGWGAAAID